MTTKRILGLLAAACFVASCGGGLKRFLYEGFDRDDWQQPERVITDLGIEEGERIADIGAGGGYFTFKLAEATGATGIVYAVDVDPDMIRYLERSAAERGLTQIRTIIAEPSDPGLPAGAIDLVFLSNTYHHIEDRPAYFSRLRAALAPGGRVAIVEYREQGLFHRMFGHATGEQRIVDEMTEAGYEVARSFDFLDQQAFVIFEIAGSADRRRELAAQRADAAAEALVGRLMGRLRSALQDGGAVEAVRVCSEVAQDITREIGGDDGLVVRRTSLRTRNPDNAPDAFELAWLEAADRAVRSGATVVPSYEVVELDEGSELRHMRPIVFPGGVCSQCHGTADEISPQVRTLLQERYPQDEAIGFRPGDLRGAISVRVPLR